MRTRRVGSITLGVTLVFFGLLFLARMFLESLDYVLIMKLWPLVFVFLGIEVLLSCLVKKEEQYKYDFAAILIVMFLFVFAIGMAGAEFLLEAERSYYYL